MKITKENVIYEIEVNYEDIPVRGNALASGDDEIDKKYEDEILERIENGDVWAWCIVGVFAKVEINGEEYTGYNSLGGCTYKDKKDFVENSGYYSDMKNEAYLELVSNIKYQIEKYKKLENVEFE